MTPSESQQPLWRYMKLSTFLLLMEGSAWFPSVASLRAGDPLEAGIGTEFYSELWGAIQETGDIEEVDSWLRKNLPDALRRMLELSPDNVRFQSQILGEQYFEEIAARTVAWCWFKSDRESAAMWSVYGNKGVAVKTTRERLEAALPPLKNCRIENINYVDRMSCDYTGFRSLISEEPKLLLRPDFLKAIEYEHEKEVRVAASCQKGDNGLMIQGIKSEDMIQEVVISPLLPMAEFTSIQKLLNCTYPTLSLSRSKLINEGYIESSFSDSILNDADDLPGFLRS